MPTARKAPPDEAEFINTDVTNFNGVLSGSDTDVQTALETIDEIFKSAQTISGVFTHSADLVLDDGAGNSPILKLVGGTNDDTFSLELSDQATAGLSDVFLKLPSASNTSYFIWYGGTTALHTFSGDGEAVWNYQRRSTADFHIYGDAHDDLFYVDVNNNRIGFADGAPGVFMVMYPANDGGNVRIYGSSSNGTRLTLYTNHTNSPPFAGIYTFDTTAAVYQDLVLGHTNIANNPLFYDFSATRWGIGTLTPSNVFSVNQGAGNAIADGWSNYTSFSHQKNEITDVPSSLERIAKVKPKVWKRKPFVSADELRKAALDAGLLDKWVKEFGGEMKELTDTETEGLELTNDQYRGNKLRSIKDPELLAFVDAQGDKLRAEKQNDHEWQQTYAGILMDDPNIDLMEEVVVRNETGQIIAWNLDSYVALLHQAIIELKEQVEALQ